MLQNTSKLEEPLIHSKDKQGETQPLLADEDNKLLENQE